MAFSLRKERTLKCLSNTALLLPSSQYRINPFLSFVPFSHAQTIACGNIHLEAFSSHRNKVTPSALYELSGTSPALYFYLCIFSIPITCIHSKQTALQIQALSWCRASKQSYANRASKPCKRDKSEQPNYSWNLRLRRADKARFLANARRGAVIGGRRSTTPVASLHIVFLHHEPAKRERRSVPRRRFQSCTRKIQSSNPNHGKTYFVS